MWRFRSEVLERKKLNSLEEILYPLGCLLCFTVRRSRRALSFLFFSRFTLSPHSPASHVGATPARRVDLLPFAGNERRLLIRPGRCLWHEFCRARRGAFEWAKVECGAGAGPRSPPSATKALTPYFEFLIMTARKSFGGACTPPPPPCRLVPSVLDPPPPRPGDRHFSFELFLVI